MLNYHPRGMYVWDTWYLNLDGQVHMFHLQKIRPGYGERIREDGALGHAVTGDLVHWTELPTCLYPGEKGMFDEGELWTGCCVWHEGRAYLYYTCNSNDGLSREGIGLALSDDGLKTFKKHGTEPVLRPDGRIYASAEKPIDIFVHASPENEDCRDMLVISDPEGGWLGYWAGRVYAPSAAETSVIALSHSDDLIDWTPLPPAFAPKRYACIEVPDVFFMDGYWWMLVLSGDCYGQRGRFLDSGLGSATIIARAENPRGPFTEVADHILMGSVNHQGFSARTVEFEGERYLFYTQGETASGSNFGTLSLPKVLKARNGTLKACWCAPLERLRGNEIARLELDRALPNRGEWGSIGCWETDGAELRADSEYDGSIRAWPGEADDCVFEGEILIDTARAAGLLFHLGGKSIKNDGLMLLLDAEASEISVYQLRQFRKIERRKMPVPRNQWIFARILLVGDIINVFIGDELTLQLFEPNHTRGKFALYCEEGRARFKNVRADAIRKDI